MNSQGLVTFNIKMRITPAVITLSSIMSQRRNNTFMIYKKKVFCVPVCALAVCSRVCSAWSRSLTSSSKASCSLLLLLFSFFRRFWIRTEYRTREGGGTDERKSEKGLQWNYQALLIYLYFTSFESIVAGMYYLFLCMVSLFPDLPGSLHREVRGALKVLWAWSVCCVVAVWIRYSFQRVWDKTEVWLLG